MYSFRNFKYFGPRAQEKDQSLKNYKNAAGCQTKKNFNQNLKVWNF